jgi:hypothetical protein
MSENSTLVVLVDGEPLPDADARAFWQRFSAWMDANKGDLGGFAKSEGLSSVRPEHSGGRAILVCSKTAPQTPYETAPKHRPPRPR